VAAWRTGRRPLRLAVVATGVAVATATLFAVSSTTLLLRERALHGSLARVAPQDLSYRADEFGLAFAASPAAARAAADALGLVGPLEPVRAVEFRPLRFRRHLVELTAVEGAGRYMRLSAGRLPRSCAPGRCEVLQIGRARLPQTLAEPGVRLVLVGKATLATPAVLGGFAEPSNATLLVSSDVDGTAALPALESIFRTASWVVPFAPEDVHEWQVRDLLGREARAQALLERVDPAFKLTAPDDALTEGRRQGQLGTRRMLLVGGEIAALLLGFAMLTAIGLRRTLAAEWRRLEERGARRSQLWLFLVAETGTAAVAGVVAGALLGLFAAGLAAGRANVSFGDLLAHGVLTASTLLLLVAACTVATGVLVLAAREHETRHVRGVRVSDVVALAALALALVAATRGGASADSLTRDRGSVVLLLLFPALVSLFAALLAVRLLPPVLRLGERATRRRGPAIRLALLSLARAPARPGAVVAFLVVSVGLALLASGYHATLDRGVRDEAAYQIPLDYTVAEGTQGVALQDAGTSPAALDYSATQGSHPVAPLDAAPLASYHRLAPAVRAYPVLRRFGDVPDLGTGFASPVVLGLPADVIRSLHGWRADFGTRSPGQLADLVGRERPVRLRGAALPAGTTGFALAAKRTGADVELALAIAKPSGEIVTVPLVAPGASRAAFGDRVPARGRLVALELSLTPEAATALAHSQAEGSVKGAPPLGTLALGPLVAYAGARRLGVVTRWRGWIGRAGARRLPGSRVRVRYGLTEGQSALFRPRQPTDGHPLPAVVSPDVARSAAPGGLVTVQNGDQHVTVRVVAVARRFPGTADGDGSFVVTEESHLQTAMDADAPGTGRPLELWLAAPARDTGALGRALERRPFSALEVSSRRELERDLRAAPLSRAIEIALLVGALVALVLAVWGLWLTLLGDIADERGELYDLEAQGASPADLRNQLRLRVAVLATLGLAGGAVLGFVLTREIVRLLQVSASGEAPIPPLVSETGWAVAAAGLVALVVAVGVLVELTVRRAFRESSPATAGGGA
jgi:FtsX-like permease family